MARILVVEDEAILANAIVTALETEFGGTVDLARTGETALELTSQQEYDVVILDRSIPPPTGFELLNYWRSHRAASPVLMLSAWTSDEDQRQARLHGASDFLSKPFTLGDLRTRVRRLLEGETVSPVFQARP